jgi:hypothetical protein
MHKQHPSITRLAVHLKNEQLCYYEEDEDNVEKILERSNQTTLTEWFKTNTNCVETRNLKYIDFTDKYTWNKPSKQWTKRKQGIQFSRMYFVSPDAGERYFLRLLLTHVCGATSFEFLRTVDNITYNTYKEACIALGLLEDDSEFDKCLQEASLMQTGNQLRHLFAMIISYNIIQKPFVLWENHKENLCEDILYQVQKKQNNKNIKLNDSIINHALNEIENILQNCGKSLCSFKDFPKLTISTMQDISSKYSTELNYDKETLKDTFKNNFSKFNNEQRQIYNTILNHIEKKDQNLFFIHGSGGCGKTFLYNTLLAKIRSENNIAIAMASTGIASLLLDGGNTAHSWLKIPLQCDNNSFCEINLDPKNKNKKNAELIKIIQEAKLFVWDEAPCMSRFVYETVDRSFKDIMKEINPKLEHIPFGGKLMLFSGDFKQLLPVIPHANRATIISQCLNRSKLWKSMTKLKLTINMRLNQLDEINSEEQKQFADYLIKVGNGEIKPKKDLGDNIIELPNMICMENSKIDHLISFVFDDLEHKYIEPKYFSERAILCTKNKTVNSIYRHILNLIPEQSIAYYSTNSSSFDEYNSNYPIEFLNDYHSSALPQHELILKKNTVIMLLRNIDITKG